MKIEAFKGDITSMEVEAIVSPENSSMTMGGGLAGLIRRKGGEEIRQDAMKHAPVPVGEAIATSVGKLPCKYIIHAPTMEKAAMCIGVYNVKLAMKAVLDCAEKNKIKEIAVPGLATGVGRVPAQEAANTMVEVIRNYESNIIEKIILVGYDEEMYNAFKTAIIKKF